MAKFRADKGYHFSKDGTEATTWAKFEKVPGSDPVVFECETSKASSVAALRKLIDGDVEGYADITEVEEKPKRSSGQGTAGKDAGTQSAGPGAEAGAGDSGQAAGADAGKDAAGAQSSS